MNSSAYLLAGADGTTGHAMAAPEELVQLASKVGTNRMLVQGAGGNVSLKANSVLWVKASGKWMSSAREEPCFAAVYLEGVRHRIQARESDPATPEVLPFSPPGLRPSIETSLHALLPQRIVLHVHSVNAIALSVCVDALPELERRLHGLQWTWVPYVRPGTELTDAVAEALQRRPAEVLVLANHGLVVTGARREEVERLLEEVERRLATPRRSACAPDLLALEKAAADTPYLAAADAELHAMAIDERLCALAVGGSLYPDHVVFLGSGMPVVERGRHVASLLDSCREAGLRAPPVVLVPHAGVLLHREISRGALAMAECLALVLAGIPADRPVRYLSREQDEALLNWEAEKYRQTL